MKQSLWTMEKLKMFCWWRFEPCSVSIYELLTATACSFETGQGGRFSGYLRSGFNCSPTGSEQLILQSWLVNYIRLIMMTNKTTTEGYIYILWSFLSFFLKFQSSASLSTSSSIWIIFFFLQQSLFCYMDNARLTWLRPQIRLETDWLLSCCFPPSRSKSAPQSQDKSCKSDENPLKQYWILFSKCIKLHKFKHWLKETWFCC